MYLLVAVGPLCRHYGWPMGSQTVLGVDGCRNGWIGIAVGSDITAHFEATIGDLVEQVEDKVGKPDVVAIDIPIGLPDATVREADRLAKTLIGPRRTSVFITPTRPALEQDDYVRGQAVNRELVGGGFSQQAWALRVKILEVDAWMRRSTMTVLEVHPELSFATMAGSPLLTRKASYSGYQQRQQLLIANEIALPVDLGVAGDQGGVDDVIDAAAAAWTAGRYVRGEAQSVPERPERFTDMIDCAIWF